MKKVLIISSNRLGDSILASGLNKYFKQQQFNITLVCGPIPYELFKFCGLIDKVIKLKKKKKSLHWFDLWKKVFLIYWDCVVDLRGTALSFFLFSKKRILYKTSKFSEIHKTKSISDLVGNKIHLPQINFDFKQKTSNLKKFEKLKRKSKDFILIAPCANWVGKTWPIDRFSKLIEKLKNEDVFSQSIFLILGSKEDKKNMKSLLDDKSSFITDFVGQISLAEMFVIMRQSRLFIGNDSGLMHLAALSGLPTIGLFGPSDVKKYCPIGLNTLVIKTSKSYKELMGYVGFDPKNVGSLMKGLSVSEVFSKTLKFYREVK